MIKLSVVVPVYNEEGTIITLLRKISDVVIEGVEVEVIVVDDGSKDSSRRLLEENPGLYATLISQPNGGKGSAVKTGLRAATGDYVLFQDADLEYDPADYTRLLKPVLLYNADVVMGSRFIAPEFTRVFYFWHKVGNAFISLFFNLLNNTTFTDIYSCYLLYRRSLINPDRLETLGWEQHAEILSRCLSGAKSLYEVPISYHGRGYDEGKKIKAYHVFAVLWAILRFRFIR
ncbi:glycosyltransferase [Magnetospirillum sp. ME-1]|uniref:glycosyltransferase family 2 protein n=1 Tax=Magnetospirillum sp. ME-1 TaxID=1639348 RepID=UPI000A17E20A|nr:glycosyltransferase family 2 protein [Magnetospirillum sp. ME-1]ARJ66496.1 glycosyltransferase [Magnetospirillum sp. ME-1]